MASRGDSSPGVLASTNARGAWCQIIMKTIVDACSTYFMPSPIPMDLHLRIVSGP